MPSARGPNFTQQLFLKVTGAPLFHSSAAAPGLSHRAGSGHFYLVLQAQNPLIEGRYRELSNLLLLSQVSSRVISNHSGVVQILLFALGFSPSFPAFAGFGA